MNYYDFRDCFEFSRNQNGESDKQVLAQKFPDAADVIDGEAYDRYGIDYIVNLRGYKGKTGGLIYIDTKRRRPGCSQYWKNGEEVALELWSDIENKKCGWTWDRSKRCHYIMFTFDLRDSAKIFLIPFQLLRLSFLKNAKSWVKEYQRGKQNSGKWRSECVFIPAFVVLEAIQAEMIDAQVEIK